MMKKEDKRKGNKEIRKRKSEQYIVMNTLHQVPDDRVEELGGCLVLSSPKTQILNPAP